MRFLRSRRAGSSDAARTADRAAEPAAGAAGDGPAAVPEAGGAGADRSQVAAPGGSAEPTDEGRAAELEQEFEAGLSDLARRQIRYSAFAWEPPAQLDRRGRWVVTEAMDGTGHDGRRVSLRAGEDLELREPGQESTDRTSWRFVRINDGRTVDLPVGPGGTWPDGLERPREGRDAP